MCSTFVAVFPAHANRMTTWLIDKAGLRIRGTYSTQQLRMQDAAKLGRYVQTDALAQLQLFKLDPWGLAVHAINRAVRSAHVHELVTCENLDNYAFDIERAHFINHFLTPILRPASCHPRINRPCEPRNDEVHGLDTRLEPLLLTPPVGAVLTVFALGAQPLAMDPDLETFLVVVDRPGEEDSLAHMAVLAHTSISTMHAH